MKLFATFIVLLAGATACSGSPEELDCGSDEIPLRATETTDTEDGGDSEQACVPRIAPEDCAQGSDVMSVCNCYAEAFLADPPIANYEYFCSGDSGPYCVDDGAEVTEIGCSKSG